MIAGTIGGGGKLEFTLIGDAVNVAARVEQLTKTTLDAILLAQPTVDALMSPPPRLIDWTSPKTVEACTMSPPTPGGRLAGVKIGVGLPCRRRLPLGM